MHLLPFIAGTLYPAPLLPLDDNGSIAWSVRALVQYIKPNTWPSKLQSSLLGYFPGSYETATGDTDAPSRHSCALPAPAFNPSPHSASAPRRSSSIASCINRHSAKARTARLPHRVYRPRLSSPRRLQISHTPCRQHLAHRTPVSYPGLEPTPRRTRTR